MRPNEQGRRARSGTSKVESFAYSRPPSLNEEKRLSVCLSVCPFTGLSGPGEHSNSLSPRAYARFVPAVHTATLGLRGSPELVSNATARPSGVSAWSPESALRPLPTWCCFHQLQSRCFPHRDGAHLLEGAFFGPLP